MELAILGLLERHQALAHDQLTALLHERPYGVRDALGGLCDQGLVEVVATREVQGTSSSGVTWWQLTNAGRQELSRWMSD
jgi:hypothetical protein